MRVILKVFRERAFKKAFPECRIFHKGVHLVFSLESVWCNTCVV